MYILNIFVTIFTLLLTACGSSGSDSSSPISSPTTPTTSPQPPPTPSELPPPLEVKINPLAGLLVDGKPFSIQGVCWSPVPINGEGNINLDFSGNVIFDSQLMHAAGINTIRTYESITDLTILDKLYESGIYVISGLPVDPPELAPQIVEQLKDHPAILMWALGNEWNYHGAYTSATQEESISRINNIAAEIKQMDPNHPVSTIYGHLPSLETVSQLTNIDIWGLNVYNGISFENLFHHWINMDTGKPMFISEYGADSYNVLKSEEDEEAQADAVATLTQEIIRANEDKIILGGTVFEWNDEWWKAGNPSIHDVGRTTPTLGGPHPDGTYNEEWWGIVDIDRKPKTSYFEISELYNTRNTTYLNELELNNSTTLVVPEFASQSTQLKLLYHNAECDNYPYLADITLNGEKVGVFTILDARNKNRLSPMSFFSYDGVFQTGDEIEFKFDNCSIEVDAVSFFQDKTIYAPSEAIFDLKNFFGYSALIDRGSSPESKSQVILYGETETLIIEGQESNGLVSHATEIKVDNIDYTYSLNIDQNGYPKLIKFKDGYVKLFNYRIDQGLVDLVSVSYEGIKREIIDVDISSYLQDTETPNFNNTNFSWIYKPTTIAKSSLPNCTDNISTSRSSLDDYAIFLNRAFLARRIAQCAISTLVASGTLNPWLIGFAGISCGSTIWDIIEYTNNGHLGAGFGDAISCGTGCLDLLEGYIIEGIEAANANIAEIERLASIINEPIETNEIDSSCNYPPEITAIFEPNINQTYIGGSTTIDIKVTDDLDDIQVVQYELYNLYNGNWILMDSGSLLSSEQDHWLLDTLQLEKEGKYSLKLWATDSAGLESAKEIIHFFSGLDSDDDGVYDERDNCPITTTGEPVDTSGCSILDNDNDTITNDFDRCPGTPIGEAIDYQGCTVDGDGDGVLENDICPHTAANEPVNQYGCSTLDDDNDTVTNDFDTCKTTPQNAKVDNQGCLYEWTLTLFSSGDPISVELISGRYRAEAKAGGWNGWDSNVDLPYEGWACSTDMAFSDGTHMAILGNSAYTATAAEAINTCESYEFSIIPNQNVSFYIWDEFYDDNVGDVKLTIYLLEIY